MLYAIPIHVAMKKKRLKLEDMRRQNNRTEIFTEQVAVRYSLARTQLGDAQTTSG
jgi:hypothetical protein